MKLVALVVILGQSCVGATIYVNAALSTGANSGASWNDSFRGATGLQAALAVSNAGDEIWVATGTYKTGAPGVDPLASFVLKDGVSVLGGFVGAEMQASQRDPAAHQCTLSGDVLGNDGDGSNIQDNAFHVVTATGVGPSAVLDGFTVMGGLAASRTQGSMPDVEAGAGLLLKGGASPVIRRCRFTGNRAELKGGGASADGGSPLFDGCRFDANRARFGAGLSISGKAAAVVRGCGFVESNANMNTVVGGGIAVGVGSFQVLASPASATIEDCLFSIQLADFLAGDGLGVAVVHGEADISRCRFIRNTHFGSGGGITCGGTARVDRCVFIGNEGKADGGAAIYGLGGHVTVTNSIFSGNDRGGFSTIMMQASFSSGEQGSVDLINCTLFDNGAAGVRHYLLLGNSSFITARNSVFWANRSQGGVAESLGASFGTGAIFLDRCDVDAWIGQVSGANIVSTDPDFVDRFGLDGVSGNEDDDLRVASGSVCIDRGNNASLPPDATLDAGGQPRFRDDPATIDTGAGQGPRVDLGAFEFVPPCPADVAPDGAINTLDLGVVLSAFGTSVPKGTGGDINADGEVNSLDLGALLSVFGAACP